MDAASRSGSRSWRRTPSGIDSMTTGAVERLLTRTRPGRSGGGLPQTQPIMTLRFGHAPFLGW